MSDLFDYINSINSKTEYLAVDKYRPISRMVERGLSMHQTTFPFAEELNKRDLGASEHYDFLFYGVPMGKRFGKWSKRDQTSDADVATIKEFYNVSSRVALLYLEILPKVELDKLNRILKTKKG